MIKKYFGYAVILGIVVYLIYSYAVDEHIEQITCNYDNGTYNINPVGERRIDTWGNVRNIDKLVGNDFMYPPIFRRDNGVLEIVGDLRIGYYEACTEWWN